MADSELINAEPVYLICGNLGTPGAQVLSLALMYDTSNGHISGQGLITQAIAPPDSRLVLRGITGQVHGLGLGGVTRVTALTGTYDRELPPPAIGHVTEKFTATLSTDQRWQGHGTFTYGGQTVKNVPVKQRG